ncbi:hypothetical protein T07_9192 [Trichinella nelsoni]|uniref:Uncharacterized protein n=1 Tax=Trichinella nelsoni TaxID=6336 RepID=A0A0V0RPB5_9BILA|nr:hypothetical protein T07_9192 [Trichinella nelsoni]
MKFSLFLLKGTNKNWCTEEGVTPSSGRIAMTNGTRGCPGKLYTNLNVTQVIGIDEHVEGCRVDAHAFYHQQQLNELKKLAAGDPRPGMRGCPGKLYTNLDATEVIRTGEHAEGCRVDAHAFYHQQQLNELKRLAAGDPRPVLEIYDELASNASTSLETAAYFPTWEQARNTMYYSRSKRYPRLPARRQDLRLTAEQTTTKSSNCWCGDGTFKIVPGWYQQLFTLHVFLRALLPGFVIINVGTSGQLEALFQYFQQERLPATKIPLWNVHGVSVRTNNHLEGWHSRMNKRARKHHLGFYQFLQLILDEQGKTETVVRQIDDGYTRGRGTVRRSTAYGVQQRWVDWFRIRLVLNIF